MKMKTKIFLFIAGLLFFVSCSEDFITKDLDKSSYDPGTFFTTKAKADQALVGAYTYLQNQYGQTWGGVHVMHMVLSDDLYETPKAAGFTPWGSINNFYFNANDISRCMELMVCRYTTCKYCFGKYEKSPGSRRCLYSRSVRCYGGAGLLSQGILLLQFIRLLPKRQNCSEKYTGLKSR